MRISTLDLFRAGTPRKGSSKTAPVRAVPTEPSPIDRAAEDLFKRHAFAILDFLKDAAGVPLPTARIAAHLKAGEDEIETALHVMESRDLASRSVSAPGPVSWLITEKGRSLVAA